ncbi:hypothetical protein F5Y05DRAFT_398894 [Hypoxylon sp. FL0543]|nr:hypothetical protein F5Y05DRAFT_398894 [Hypoxylon sp. FL0543]
MEPSLNANYNRPHDPRQFPSRDTIRCGSRDEKSDKVYWQVTGYHQGGMARTDETSFMVDSAGKRRHVDWLSSW